MNIIDITTTAELSSLNEQLLILQRQASEPGHWKTDESELEEKQSRRDYVAGLVRWYQGKVEEVLALVGERSITLRGSKRFDGHSEEELASSRELAMSILAGMVHSQSIDSVLPSWANQLVHRGLLPAEAAARLDLTAPVDTERLQRKKEAQQKENAFVAGRDKLKAAALSYAKEKGNPWGLQDYLDCWNSNPNRPRDEAGLLEFARDLGARRLLPFGDRLQSSIDDLWLKLKELKKGVMAG